MLRDRNPKHWKLWIFYYNPDQPHLFVAKRYGPPTTLNFGRPMAWVITAIPFTIAIAGFVADRIHLTH